MEDVNKWKAFRQGDQEAFQEIFRQYIRLLYKYGSRFTPDAALVEDAIQDLFLYLWQKRSTLGDTDNVKFYLMAALRRNIIQKLRKVNSSHSVDAENYHFELEFNIEELMIRDEVQQSQTTGLQEAVNNLSARQKEVVYLKYYKQLSYEEVGAAMNINYQSVRNLLHNALKALKEHIHLIKVLVCLASWVGLPF